MGRAWSGLDADGCEHAARPVTIARSAVPACCSLSRRDISCRRISPGR